MIRVLVVDDEIWVCQLIKKIINWEEIGFIIIGEAHDGFEALKKIKDEKPDLVLTDIRMPGIDGVTLIKKVQEHKLKTQFIIISGHSDFSFAQEAIKYGALGYILKPIDEEELIFFLQKIKEKIASFNEIETIKQELGEKLSVSVNQLREQFFLKLYSNEFKDTNLDIDGINKKYVFSFQNGIYQIVLYQIDFKHEIYRKRKINEIMLTNLARYISLVFQEECFENYVFFQDQRLIQIINYDIEKYDLIYKKFALLRKKINDDQKLEVGYELTISLGIAVNSIEKWGDSFELAQKGLYMRIAYNYGELIDIAKYPFLKCKIQDIFTIEDEKKVEGCIKNCDIDNLILNTHLILRKIFSEKSIGSFLIVSVAKEILRIFSNELKRKGIYTEQIQQEQKRIEKEFENCYRIEHIEKYLVEIFKFAKENCHFQSRSRTEKIIDIVKKYVSEHYNEEVSLSAIADEVSLNQKYLGELFKKEVGVNFGDYLLQYRMDMAEVLLRDVKNRVNEVSYMVGYKDPKYFGKLFKKTTGLSPAEYCKLFS